MILAPFLTNTPAQMPQTVPNVSSMALKDDWGIEGSEGSLLPSAVFDVDEIAGGVGGRLVAFT
jgi:hypothetical protein